MAPGFNTGAKHDAAVPPFDPAQDQVQGPLPLTDEAEPVPHRLEAGAEETAVPLAEPHAPLMGPTTGVVFGAWHCAVAPPFDPAQLQV
jgi:hypothetical protein